MDEDRETVTHADLPNRLSGCVVDIKPGSERVERSRCMARRSTDATCLLTVPVQRDNDALQDAPTENSVCEPANTSE